LHAAFMHAYTLTVITTVVQDIIRKMVNKVHGGGGNVVLGRQCLGIIADMS
jgi:hypothetical protein